MSPLPHHWPVYERNGRDQILDTTAVAILLLHAAFIGWNWKDLPPEIPMRFDLSGEPRLWGSREFIFLMPSISAAIAVSLAVLSRFPRSFNFPFSLSESNSLYQTTIAVRLIQVINIICQLLFVCVSYDVVQGAFGRPLLTWLLPAFLVCIFGSIGIYLMAAFRTR